MDKTTDIIELEEIKSEVEDYESSPAQYEITTYPADFTLEVLYQKWKKGNADPKKEELVIPDFQRQYVWNQAQASKLIESFLIGLPVPAIFLFTERNSTQYLVIDGQQRLKSIFYFFDGFFGEEANGKRKVFKLKGLNPNSKWYNKTFEQLEEADRNQLLNSVLRAFIVKQLDPNDETSVYHIFERLNTGGTHLNNQEVRNCIYGGSFNEKLLKDLNSYPNWRRIVGKENLDARQRDLELVLRFFALQTIESYKKPLKDYLTFYMRKNRNASYEDLDAKTTTFTRTCDLIVDSLGEKPFHIRAGLNAAVFDSVMVAVSKNLENIPDDFQTRFLELTGDSEYLECTQSRTTDEDIIRKRFAIAENRLFGV